MRKLLIAPISGALALLLAAPLAAQDQAGGCATLVMNDKTLRNEGVYGVTLLEIDGKAPFRRKYDHQVSPGSHTLLLGEKIPMHDLSFSVQRNRDRTIRNRELTLEFKKDERVVIAAKLNDDKKDDIEAYWTPLVIKDESKACKPE
jgi:hypothetical protein